MQHLSRRHRNFIFNTSMIVVVGSSLVVQYYPAYYIYAVIAVSLCLFLSLAAIISRLVIGQAQENVSVSSSVGMSYAENVPSQVDVNQSHSEKSDDLLKQVDLLKQATLLKHVEETSRLISAMRPHAARTDAVVNFRKVINEAMKENDSEAYSLKNSLKSDQARIIKKLSWKAEVSPWEEFLRKAQIQEESSIAPMLDASTDASKNTTLH